ncbi:GlxA family transcriptional regulator [Streptomyces sp. NBC_01363]|uniref:GlxA family transcriptional regulator n=1 Tax=Streptomyces sp. NBC_01363 TaxID=2903840 RepID=UPI0022519D58|nr:helix-turn-helix domain-containing protein [Streptomyces sp. NBC_01363]MCX4734984.1 helix-turn-helix domain-containing protein [Streptomyces sp. NBC_01363]
MPVIAVLALDGVPGHELTGPGMCFGTAARQHPHVAYELRYCTAPGFRGTGSPAPFAIDTPWGLEGLADADTVLLPGHAGFRDEPEPGVADALRAAADRGARIGAFGTGTFALAATGLLDGRRAATGRPYAAELARRHPLIDVDPEGAVVDADPFHSAAGVLGGLDLCLHLITLDHGVPVAIETERQVFMQLHAPADADADAEEAPPAASRLRAGPHSLGPTIRWMEAHLYHPLTLNDIADHAGLTARGLNRRFQAETGLSPLQYLLRARVQAAQRLLERGDEPVERIAARTGFGTSANLRHHFQHHTGTGPRVYRTAFRSLVATLTWAEGKNTEAAEPDASGGPEDSGTDGRHG